MKPLHQRWRGALLLTTALVLTSIVATPAQATITPVNTAISATSTDSSFIVTPGVVIACPTTTFTGLIAADGRSASGTLEFSSNARTPCTLTVLGSSSNVSVVCSLRITLRSTASTAGVSATGDVVIDAANPARSCSMTYSAHGCTITFGPQTIRPATISQAAQTVSLSSVNVAATGSGGICGTGARISTFTAIYRITTPRIAIS
jgi:hypothetical protein